MFEIILGSVVMLVGILIGYALGVANNEKEERL